MADYRTGNTDLVTYLKFQGTIKVLPFEDKVLIRSSKTIIQLTFALCIHENLLTISTAKKQFATPI